MHVISYFICNHIFFFAKLLTHYLSSDAKNTMSKNDSISDQIQKFRYNFCVNIKNDQDKYDRRDLQRKTDAEELLLITGNVSSFELAFVIPSKVDKSRSISNYPILTLTFFQTLSIILGDDGKKSFPANSIFAMASFRIIKSWQFAVMGSCYMNKTLETVLFRIRFIFTKLTFLYPLPIYCY